MIRFPLFALGILVLASACGALQGLQSQGLNQLTSDDASAESSTDSQASLNSSETSTASKEPDVSFLSAAAQATLAEVKSVHEQIRSKVDAVCAPDTTLRDTIKAALDAIKNDSSKTDEEKRTARDAVFAQYKDQVTADRARMETCHSENEATLSVWKDLGKAVHDACLIGGGERGPRGPGGPGGQDGSMPPPPHDGQGPGQGQGPGAGQGQDQGHGPGHGHGPDGGKGPGNGQGPGELSDEQKQAFETKLTGDACTQAVADAKTKLQ